VALPFFCLAAAESLRADSKDYLNHVLSDEMLIFDRQPDPGPATASPLAKVSTSEHAPRTTSKNNGPRRPTGHHALAKLAREPFPSAQVHRALGPGPDWTLATLLVGAMAVLLFLGIKDKRHRHPTIGTAPRTGEVEKGCSPGPSSGQVSNEGKSDAAYHGS
jgi:hypothetical protein